MIKRLLDHQISPIALLTSTPGFVWTYVSTRRWINLLIGLPAIAFSVLLIGLIVQAGSPEAIQQQQALYIQRSSDALAAGDRSASMLHFKRLIDLSADKQAATLEFAKQIYERSNAAEDTTVILLPQKMAPEATEPDEFARRAILLMQSLAPNTQRGGSTEAHQFLAEHWASRTPQTDATQLLTLQHTAFSRPTEAAPTRQLAEFLTQRNYHAAALRVLRSFAGSDTEILLATALSYHKSGDTEAAQRELARAEQLLREQVSKRPGDTRRVTQLGQVLGAQGRIMESLFALAEGCRHNESAQLKDRLITSYTIWLSQLSNTNARQQLNNIALALNPETPAADKFTTKTLTLSTGQQIDLPEPITSLHTALMEGEASWLLPLLLGTDRAAIGDFVEAETLLKEANREAPDHPVIANNLAWILYKLATQPAPADTAPPTAPPNTLPSPSDRLAEAWPLASRAVELCPDNISFRETRGRIAAQLQKWDIAVEDFERCVNAGRDSQQVLTALVEARRGLKPAPTTVP